MLTGGFLHFPHVAISDVTETPCQTGILRRWNGLFLTFSELKPTIIIIIIIIITGVSWLAEDVYLYSIYIFF